ncbi:MAG TPA: low affinity iron permease family protein [Nitrospira sp.]|nr:low affinity iron permease family protein [Nitrospira sp.]
MTVVIPPKHNNVFNRVANACSRMFGTAGAFWIACGVVAIWALTGPLFNFSDTWQLVINTGTTIVTFLMVFLIQNTQNRDSAALQLKLAEIIRSTQGAHNAMIDLEKLSQTDLDKIRSLYEHLAERARSTEGQGDSDTGTPAVPEEQTETRVIIEAAGKAHY